MIHWIFWPSLVLLMIGLTLRGLRMLGTMHGEY